MGRGDIEARISSLYSAINTYRANISELESYKSSVASEESQIENIYDWNKSYDMTMGESWIGKTNEEARDMQQELAEMIYKAGSDTDELVYQIANLINTLNQMISNCYSEISSLQWQLQEIIYREQQNQNRR
ncbi:MAG: DUF5082 family protein [Pseudobutyrivibrio sp.]|nr:DUF5082 family protein [Pseudobutyrivibrio sp.]